MNIVIFIFFSALHLGGLYLIYKLYNLIELGNKSKNQIDLIKISFRIITITVIFIILKSAFENEILIYENISNKDTVITHLSTIQFIIIVFLSIQSLSISNKLLKRTMEPKSSADK